MHMDTKLCQKLQLFLNYFPEASTGFQLVIVSRANKCGRIFTFLAFKLVPKPHSKNKIEAKWATGGGAANQEPGVYSINTFHESHAFLAISHVVHGLHAYQILLKANTMLLFLLIMKTMFKLFSVLPFDISHNFPIPC